MVLKPKTGVLASVRIHPKDKYRAIKWCLRNDPAELPDETWGYEEVQGMHFIRFLNKQDDSFAQKFNAEFEHGPYSKNDKVPKKATNPILSGEVYLNPHTQERFKTSAEWFHSVNQSITTQYPHVVKCDKPWGCLTHLDQFKLKHGLPPHGAIIMRKTGDFTRDIRLQNEYKHLLPVLQKTVDNYQGQWPTNEQAEEEKARFLAALRG